MFSTFLVKGASQPAGALFSGKLKLTNNPSFGCAYRTTKVLVPIPHEGAPTIKFVEKKISGPTDLVPPIQSIPQQKGSGIELEDVLEHPLKVSEAEFDELLKSSRKEDDGESANQDEGSLPEESEPGEKHSSEDDLMEPSSSLKEQAFNAGKNVTKELQKRPAETKKSETDPPKRKRVRKQTKYDFKFQ